MQKKLKVRIRRVAAEARKLETMLRRLETALIGNTDTTTRYYIAGACDHAAKVSERMRWATD